MGKLKLRAIGLSLIFLQACTTKVIDFPDGGKTQDNESIKAQLIDNNNSLGIVDVFVIEHRSKSGLFRLEFKGKLDEKNLSKVVKEYNSTKSFCSFELLEKN